MAVTSKLLNLAGRIEFGRPNKIWTRMYFGRWHGFRNLEWY